MFRLFRLLSLLAILLFCEGCTPGAFAQTLSTLMDVSQGAQYVGSLVETTEDHASQYFDRHPNLERERKVNEALSRAKQTLAALHHVLAAADAASSEEIERARREALDAYEALRAVLSEMGVLDAIPPEGGAETDAPKPEPFSMPPRAEVEALI